VRIGSAKCCIAECPDRLDRKNARQFDTLFRAWPRHTRDLLLDRNVIRSHIVPSQAPPEAQWPFDWEALTILSGYRVALHELGNAEGARDNNRQTIASLVHDHPALLDLPD
jgi:hypothetical protein